MSKTENPKPRDVRVSGKDEFHWMICRYVSSSEGSYGGEVELTNWGETPE